eukprot:gene699-8951_t
MEASQEDREWKILENKIADDCTVEIFINSKKNQQENSKEIPSKLYASPKYDLKQVIKGIKGDDLVLMGVLKVVNVENDEEVLNQKNEKILSVTTEGVFKKNNDELTIDLKFKFEDESFDPKNLAEPLLRIKSAAFKVFARKPSNASLKENSSTVSPNSPKVGEKRKLDVTLTEYFSFLEDLIEHSNNLDETERKPALDDAIHKLISVETTNSELLRSTNLLPPSKRKNYLASTFEKKK